MRALIVAEPWISLILAGRKTWEMRKSGCAIRGPIALVRKGSGQVVATATVIDSLPAITSAAEYARAEHLHQIPADRQPQALRDGWATPWVLADARPLARPVPYRHPPGAVIWVRLIEELASEIAKQTGQLAPSAPAPKARSDRAERASPPPRVSSSSRPNNFTAASIGEERTIPLTGGNVRNGHIYLPLDFLPPDAIGGSNKTAVAPQSLTVTFAPGVTVQTDVDGTKRILRARGAVRDFFARIDAKEGDVLRLTRAGPYRYTVAKV